MDWDKLRIFHVVASAGSFTRAGQRLGSSQSAISRQIKALEDHLRLSLFTRHARGLVLTQEGKELFDTTSALVQKIEESERRLTESKDSPRGVLRVTTMVTFGAVWLTPHLKEFTEQYPEISVQIILSDHDLDLSAGEADVAIRLHDPVQADLIQRPLAEFHSHIYASPDYLDQRGTPVTAADLDRHHLIGLGVTDNPILKSLDWLPTVGRGKADRREHRHARVQVNNLYGMLHAVEAGMGLAVLPDYLVHGRKKLVRVLPEIEGTPFNSYFCYPPELKGSLRVAVFRDFMVHQIRKASNIL